LAGQDQISSTLRELRARSGLSGVSAAAMAGISQSRISRIESGVFVPKDAEIRTLCLLYRASAAATDELLRTAADLRASAGPARLVIRRGDAHKIQQRIAGIEADSADIGVFQPLLIPGLLQTADYMRAVFADGQDITREDLERSIAARTARTQILASGRTFTFLMAEGALRWQASNPVVMAAQLDQLAELTTRMRVGVIPWTRPANVFTTTGFSLYDRRTVILGTRSGTSFITDPRDVADYLKLFDALTDLAVFDRQAQSIMTTLAGAYRAL
jgi:transcriptional regulator with XRE-family HTH domain